MLVHNKQFIMQYARYEHKSQEEKNRSIFVTWLATLQTCSAQLIIDCWFNNKANTILHRMHDIKMCQHVFKKHFRRRVTYRYAVPSTVLDVYK